LHHACRLSALALCLAAISAFAQDSGSGDNWRIGLGVAGIFGPEFPGADDRDAMGVPFIDVQYQDRFFLNVPDGLGVNLVDTTRQGRFGYKFGVAIAPEFQDREREDAPNLPEVDMTALGSVFGSISFRPFSLSATLAGDLIGNGHDGYWAEIELDWTTRLGGRGFAGVGPFVRFADGDYMAAFYSVSPDVAAISGLEPFDADGGTESIGVSAYGAWRLTREWELFSQFSYERLGGDAEDSPISVDDEQLSAIVAIVYRFP